MTPEVTGDDIQLENGGFTRIHNAIVETLAKANLSPLEFRIVFLILRKTYGFGKKADVISLSQFEETCDASRRATITALQNLVRLGVIQREHRGAQSYAYGFNKYIETWLPETFVSRYAGRSKNFHPTPTSEAVGLVKLLGTSEAVDTRTSEAVDTRTSEAVDTHKRKKETLKEINSAPTKPKTAKPRDPLLDNPAVMLYREVIERTANNVQREVIAATVTDLDRWREVLREWKAHGWKPDNVPGMIDRYKGNGKGSGPIRSNGNGQQNHTGSIASEANRIENERRAAIPANRTPRARPGGDGSGAEVPGVPGPPGSPTSGPSG